MKQAPSEMKFINRVAATAVLAMNIYFVPLTFSVLTDTEHYPDVTGILILLSLSLLIVPAAMAWSRRLGANIIVMVINILGAGWCGFWIWLFTVVPVMMD